MEITISLPDKVFANVANIADKTNRRVDEVIADNLNREFSLDVEELEKQITVCSDREIIELSSSQMPEKQDERLSFLLQTQSKRTLRKSEQEDLWKLMDLNRLTTLKKALAMREISRRGLNGKD